MHFDLLIPVFGILYLIALIAFLIFLRKIPRLWRLLAYAAFCLTDIFVARVSYFFEIFNRNCMSGIRTLVFFTAMQEQFSAGTYGDFSPKLLNLPEYGPGILLSLLAAAAIFGGLICCWLKIRWYSYVILPVAIILSFGYLFEYPGVIDRRRDFEEHNELRRQTYDLLVEKREQGVTDRQIAEAIAANLKDFHYSYENRKYEKESVARILSALRDLTPPQATVKK